MNATDPAERPFEEPVDTAFFGPRPGFGWELWAMIAIATVVFMVMLSGHVGTGAWLIVPGIALITAAGAAMLPRGARLPAPWAWGAAAAAALLAQITPLVGSGSAQDEVYAPWYAYGVTIVCSVLILRRRAGAGWAGALAAHSGTLIIGIMAGEPLAEWGSLAVRQAAALVAIQAFAILLTRGEKAIAALQKEERARLTAMRLRETVMEQRHAEAERIRDLVTSPLLRIAAGDTSPELRLEAMLLEGALRDALRGRRLAAGPVPAAARAARARGMDVLLLDDLGDPGERPVPESIPSTVLAWIASRVSDAEAPRATARLAIGADGRPAVSFYAENSGEAPELLVFDPPDALREDGEASR